MAPHLSNRAFKFLRTISKRAGFEFTDEEIYDIGARFLTLSEIATKHEQDKTAILFNLTESESEALKAIQDYVATNGSTPSARELSRALGYRSSRSGHLLLQRFVDRGVLVRRGQNLVLAREREGDLRRN